MVCQACGEWAASAPLCGDCLQRVNDGHYERNIAPYEPREEVSPAR
jgi:hypothetical protein